MNNKKLTNYLKTKKTSLWDWIKEGIKLSSVVSIAALYLSYKAMYKSDLQFESNNTSQIQQDSLNQIRHNKMIEVLNLQVNSMKIQNDSVMAILNEHSDVFKRQIIFQKEQNKIISKNLAVSKIQLALNDSIQKRQIESERCILSIAGSGITIDTSLKMEGFFRPKITTPIINIGKRTCFKYRTYRVILSKNYEVFSVKIDDSVNPLNSEESMYSEHITNIDYVNDFYYVFSVQYDDIFIKNNKVVYFYHYSKMRNNHSFYDCKLEEQKKIMAVLNLKKINFND
jgi:hypothetical protein